MKTARERKLEKQSVFFQLHIQCLKTLFNEIIYKLSEWSSVKMSPLMPPGEWM